MEETKKELTPEQQQRRKKMLVFPIMFIAFGACMWLIFAPSKSEKESENRGINTEVPSPKDESIVGDKQTAYEQDNLEEQNRLRKIAMQSLGSMFGGDDRKAADEYDLRDAEASQSYGSGNTYATIQSSTNAYRDINRQLGSFYEAPKEDPEKTELAKQIEELNAKLQENESRKNSIDEQVALMEKSYQMAAKYLPQGQMQGATAENTITSSNGFSNGKAQATPIKQVVEQTVSGLPQAMSDAEFVADYSQPRNFGFNTAVGTVATDEKNTIKACIHESTTLTNGQNVRLRLLEPMQAGNMTIPRNSVITGSAKILGERLEIIITSMEHGGTIVPVELTVYDTDGQQGIFIPGSMEINAAKEIAANMGSSLGTSVSITNQSAGEQLTTELGKGLIQGTSQYVSKKISVVKVSLKAGYQVMLLSKQN